MARNMLLRQTFLLVQRNFNRNFGVSAVCTAKASGNLDPIQKLFVEKLKEYGTKSKSAGGKFIDASPEFEQQVHDELEKLKKQYGATADFSKFPTFNFSDPTLEAVDTDINVKAADPAKEVAESDDSYNDWEEQTYFEPVKTAEWWNAEKEKFLAERKQLDAKFEAKHASSQ